MDHSPFLQYHFRRPTFCRSFSCCSVSLFRIAAILAPAAGAGGAGRAAGIVVGVGSRFFGVFSISSTSFFPFLEDPEDALALPMVSGMILPIPDFFDFLSPLLPLVL